MDKVILEKQLIEWVAQKESNGILQHSKSWETAKVFTIGGSSLSVIQGTNPYTNICELVSNKIGFSKFVSDVKPQWGNLFEDVIKRYVEHDLNCVILGEHLYVTGTGATSYSPDGLTVLEIELDPASAKKTAAIVLIEFKCPYSRIPSGKVPVYYVSQPKMGMEVLKIPSISLFIEGVFRKCTWEQLGNNSQYDKSLVSKSSGENPLSYGIIGFYVKKNVVDNLQSNMFEKYLEHYVEYGDVNNNYISNDLGESDPTLFKILMNAYDKKIITPWYGSLIPITNDECENKLLDNDLDTYNKFCAKSDYINLGVLPWKLFRIDYNKVYKENNYLEKWMPKINDVVNIVRKCLDPQNASIKQNLYNSYMRKLTNHGFSDE